MKHYKEETLFFKIHLKWLLLLFFAQIFHKKVLFWGASLFLKKFLNKYKIHLPSVIGVIDKNIYKINKDFCGYKIISSQEIDSFKPDYIIFAIRNNHKRTYQEVKLNLQLSDYKSALLKDDFTELEQEYSEFNDSRIEQLNKTLEEFSPQRTVYIFQCGFFDKNGKDFYAGGAERYALDLATLIAHIGYKPILIQAGNQDSDTFWMKNMQDLTIIGVNAKGSNYFKIINRLKEPALAIYSGIVEWETNIAYRNVLLISHGITWDIPRTNADNEFLKTILKTFNNIVSVDTNTISWFRSTFSNYIFNKKINFQYVPNYVDIEKYKPISKNRTRLKITYPRRCSEERGFWLFADIVPDIIKMYRDIIIEFVGYVHTEEIQNKLEELRTNYPNNIIHRVCAQEKMFDVYRNTDISVIPTLYSEGTSLSCLEAMSCGNTVIATNIGGLPNLIINDYNGKLINPDKHSLFSAITEVVESKSLRNYLSGNAVAVCNAFSKRVWEEKWLDILSKYLK